MRLPDDTHRHAIIGATGSGKTQNALWHLSHRRFDQIPWVIYNFKHDASIDAIPYAQDITLEEIPSRPGIYIAHPLPDDDDGIEEHMWGIWREGNTGVYVDEGYMIGRSNRAFRALLTQGRSKHIPMMVLSQRPVWMDRFVFSESEFYQVFRLQHKDDNKKMEQVIPADLSRKLPPFHSWYYDVGEDKVTVLRPVPELPVILSTFERRLRGNKKVV